MRNIDQANGSVKWAMATLPSAPCEEDAHKISSQKPYKLCKLKVNSTSLGTLISFTMPRNLSPRKLLNLIQEANAEHEGTDPLDLIPGDKSATERDLRPDLMRQPGMFNVFEADTTYTFTILKSSGNLNRVCQEDYLMAKSLKPVDTWIIFIGSALCWDKSRLDLFQGYSVRCRQGQILSYYNNCFTLRLDCFPGSQDPRVLIAGAQLE